MDLLKKKDDPDNFRNVQPLNGRLVYFYESPECVKRLRTKNLKVREYT